MRLPQIPLDHVSYQLRIRVNKAICVAIGALGRHHFPQGEYVYTGSAKRHLHARLARHLRPEKKLRWHIDYLLAHPAVCIVSVTTSNQAECDWNRQMKGDAPVAGFGASDCRSGCGAHLVRLESPAQPKRCEEDRRAGSPVSS